MKIHDLVKPIDQMTTEELLERVRSMRHRREVARPVAKAKAERAEKKAVRSAGKKLDKTLEAMTDEEKLALIQLLGGSA